MEQQYIVVLYSTYLIFKDEPINYPLNKDAIKFKGTLDECKQWKKDNQ